MDLTTIVLFVFTVIGALISCASAVISYQSARKPASLELQNNVDSLMSVVEKFTKEIRKEKMQRVRAGISESGQNSSQNIEIDSMQERPLRRSKEELRLIARAKGRNI